MWTPLVHRKIVEGNFRSNITTINHYKVKVLSCFICRHVISLFCVIKFIIRIDLPSFYTIYCVLNHCVEGIDNLSIEHVFL